MRSFGGEGARKGIAGCCFFIVRCGNGEVFEKLGEGGGFRLNVREKRRKRRSRKGDRCGALPLGCHSDSRDYRLVVVVVVMGLAA